MPLGLPIPEQGEVRIVPATKKKIFRWILITILIFLGFGLVSWLCRKCGNALSRSFFLALFGGEATIFTAFAAIFVGGNIKSFPPQQLFKKFCTCSPVIFALIILSATLVMAAVSKDVPASENNDTVKVDSTQPKTDDESSKKLPVHDDPVLDQNDLTVAPESVAPPKPYLSLAEWENDPFLLHLDTYCNYHVEDKDVADIVCSLLSECQEEISVRGRYDTDLLEGKDSEYAEHTAYANELREGYMLLNNAQILPDKQLEFLNDEIQNRIAADGLYQVSDNERIIGDIYLKLGDACLLNGNIADAHKNYVQAFSWFQTTFRTAVAEGAASATLDTIHGRIVNTKDKLLNLDGIDSREKSMAPKIVYAFEQILAEN